MSIALTNLGKTPLTIPTSPRGKVIRWLTSAILSGELSAGEPLPAERALAESLNVSRQTVRAALDELVHSGVIVAPGDGCMRRVAPRSAEPGTAGPLGLMSNTVVILGISNLTTLPVAGCDSPIAFAAARRLEQAGRHIMAVNPKHMAAGDELSFGTMRPQGVLVTYGFGESAQGQALMRLLAQSGIPVVAYGDMPGMEPYDRVTSDHQMGAYQLTRTLIERGCRRILPFWRFPATHHWLTQREQGYARAMAEAGLERLPPLRTPELNVTADVTCEDEYRHTVRMMAGYLSEYVLNKTPIDALMLATDTHAIQAAGALRLLGQVPNQEISVVGYDNSYMGSREFKWERTPPLATVDKRNDEIAAAMVKLLLARLSKQAPAEPQCVRVPPVVVFPQQKFS